MRKAVLRAFAILAVALLAGGCGGVEIRPDAVEVGVLPVRTGGIVAAQACRALSVSFEQAAPRLGAWAELIGAQCGTVCARTLDAAQDPAPQLADALGKAGISGGATAAALKAWIDGAPDRCRQARALVAELGKCMPPGIGSPGTDPGGEYGVVVFKSGERTMLALADIRRGGGPTERWLLEIHFHVSSSYVAGANLYHLASGPAPVLTVQVYSWISQVEGAFGALARGMAERELRTQAEATWHEVAAYLAKTSSEGTAG